MQHNRKFLILREKITVSTIPINKIHKGPVKHYFHLHASPNKFRTMSMPLHVVCPSINSWHDLTLTLNVNCLDLCPKGL